MSSSGFDFQFRDYSSLKPHELPDIEMPKREKQEGAKPPIQRTKSSQVLQRQLSSSAKAKGPSPSLEQQVTVCRAELANLQRECATLQPNVALLKVGEFLTKIPREILTIPDFSKAKEAFFNGIAALASSPERAVKESATLKTAVQFALQLDEHFAGMISFIRSKSLPFQSVQTIIEGFKDLLGKAQAAKVFTHDLARLASVVRDFEKRLSEMPAAEREKLMPSTTISETAAVATEKLRTRGKRSADEAELTPTAEKPKERTFLRVAKKIKGEKAKTEETLVLSMDAGLDGSKPAEMTAVKIAGKAVPTKQEQETSLLKAKQFKEIGNYNEALGALLEGHRESVSPLILRRVEKLSSDQIEKAVSLFERAIEVSQNTDVRAQFEKEGIELLAKIMAGKETGEKGEKVKLTSAENEKLDEFILYATKNKDLNARLMKIEKQTDVEEFLAKFTHKSNLFEKFDSAMTNASKILGSPSMKAVLSDTAKIRKLASVSVDKHRVEKQSGIAKQLTVLKKQMEDVEKGIKERLETAVSLGDEKAIAQARLIGLQIQKMHNLMHEFQYVSPFDQGFEHWAQSFFEQSIQFLKIAALAEQGTDSVRKTLEAIKTNAGNIVKLRNDIAAKLQEFTSLEDRPSLTLSELQVIESFKKLGEICPNPQGVETLGRLSASCTAASHTIDSLNLLLQSTSSYKPGDVSFLEDAAKRKFEGKKKPSFLKALREAPQKGPFEIQPFFTGNLTHAAIVNSQHNSLCTSEMIDTYANTDVAFTEATYNKVYTPDFSKIITEDGMKKLREIYPGKNDQFIIADVTCKYQRKLGVLIDSRKEELEKVTLSHKKAALAPFPRLLKRQDSKPKELAPIVETEMFCSEYVSKIMSMALTELQADLSSDIALRDTTQRAPLPAEIGTFFHDITPKGAWHEKVSPNKLEGFMKAFFHEMPKAPLVQLLVKSN
jgi:hypothetical protein